MLAGWLLRALAGADQSEEGAASLLQLRRGAAALGSGALLGRLGELSASLREARSSVALGNGTASLDSLQEELDVLKSYVVLVDVAAVEKLRSGIAQCNAAFRSAQEGEGGVNSSEAAMRQAEARHDACRAQATTPPPSQEPGRPSHHRSRHWGCVRKPWRRPWAKPKWLCGHTLLDETGEGGKEAWRRAARAAAARRRPGCDGLQRELESAFCAFRAKLIGASLELEKCRLSLERRMSELGVSEELLRRAHDWQARAFIAETRAQCFVESLSSSSNSTRCEDLPVDTSHLEMPFPQLATCNTSSVAAYPCESAWLQECLGTARDFGKLFFRYYGRKAWHPSARPAACTPCPALPGGG
ncbi:unnamed protein product [Symbiodinium natans]|uniref:Uncharacterized protein n=1 Tax=Symbiodinium natans TaxID=878477 RepID=A0A812TNX3_9DINO|nr:unnamed protein product [Symbiodinium natans]